MEAHFIHVLSSCPAGPRGSHLDVSRVDVQGAGALSRLGLGHDSHSRCAGVRAPAAIALHSMNSALISMEYDERDQIKNKEGGKRATTHFVLESLICLRPSHVNYNRLVSCFQFITVRRN